MPLSDKTVEALMGLFSLKSGKERYEYALATSQALDPETDEGVETMGAMAVAAYITVDKATVIKSLVEQSVALRLNIDGMSEEERERLSIVIAAVFLLPDEEFNKYAQTVNPLMQQVQEVYQMHAELEGLIGDR